jgi:hypothetical protein
MIITPAERRNILITAPARDHSDVLSRERSVNRRGSSGDDYNKGADWGRGGGWEGESSAMRLSRDDNDEITSA